MYNVSPWHKKMWRATGLCCKMSTKKLLDHVDSCYMLLGLQSVDSPTNKNLHIFCFSEASETRCSRVERHLEVDMASLKFRTPSSWSHWSSQLATSRGNRLSGWGDQTLENPRLFPIMKWLHWFCLQIVSIVLYVLMTFFWHISTPAPMDHWPILQRTLRNHVAVESVAAWTNEVVDAEPMERDQTVGRPHFQQPIFVDFPQVEKTGQNREN